MVCSARYSTDSGTDVGRQYFSCLQWECEPGYYSASLPNCYHDFLSPPSDDFQTEASDVEECSDDTCCEIEETHVYTCKDYPHSCPTWYERSLVACTSEATDGYPICGEGVCCGVATPSPSAAPTPAPPTPTPSAQRTPAPTPGPTRAAPTQAPTRSPTPAPPTPTPSAQRTPTPTPCPTSLAPTQAPTRSPTPAPPTPTPSVQRTPAPTPGPTSTAPTQAPTRSPTPAPPTPTPSVQRTPAPTPGPTITAPTQAPTRSPTPAPPTPTPSVQRTPAPTPGPTRAAPTQAPTRPQTPAPLTPTPAPFTPAPSVQGTPAPIPRPTIAPLLETLPPTVGLAVSVQPVLDSPFPTRAHVPEAPPLETRAPRSTPNPSMTLSPEIVPSPTPEAPSTGPSTFAPEASTMAPSADAGQALRSVSVAAGTASAVSVISVGAVLMAILFSGSGSGSVASRSAGTLGAATSNASVRPPSATLALLLTGQLQFIATLSLVDSTGAEDSLVTAFAENIRWVNVWPPESTVTDFTHLEMTRRLQEAESAPRCELSPAGPGEIGVVVFIGNLVLVAGFLVALFVVHVTVASGAEAYWLTKHRAEKKVDTARRQGTSIRDLSVHRWTKRVARVYPNTDAEAAVQDGAPQRRLQQWHSQSTLSPGATSDDLGQFADDTDEEENDGQGPTREESRRLNLISECRDHLTSKWLHFPHVELVFLFFVFQGAVAAEVSALRGSTCPWVVFMAVASLVLFPVLMIAMVCRTIFVRVRPDDIIVFETTADPDDPEGGCGDQQQQQPTFLSRVKAGWDEDRSLLAWADKGQWTTAEKADRVARREGDWFRIGFEPLFVDYTKHGSLFMAYTLVQSAAMSCVGVLVDESARQLWLFFGLHFSSCIVLVLLKPFANGLVNIVGACQSGMDAICMALLAISAAEWKGTEDAKRADTTVMIIQLLALIVLVIPMYVDTVAVLLATIGKRARRIAEEAVTSGAEEERKFVRRYIRRAWAATWCKMLGKNMFACLKDTSAGLRRPPAPTAGTPDAPSRAAVVHGTAAPTERHTADRMSSALPSA